MGVCDVPVISKVCEIAGEGAGALVAAPFDWIASAIGKAAAWMFKGVWELIDTTTLVDVTKPEYVRVYNTIFGIAVFIMLIFFLLQLLTGLVRRDPGALHRAVLGLAKSVLGSFLAITLTATLLEITDQVCTGIVQATGMTMEQLGARIGVLAAGLAGLNLAAPGAGAIITIFVGGLLIAAVVVVWFSLLIRKALLLVVIVLAPVAMAGASWDGAREWIGKWASLVLALIVSKLIVLVVFLVAIGQVSAPIEADLASIADPIAGVALMFVAAFAPYMAFRFISFVGFDLYNITNSVQDAKRAMDPRSIPMLSGKPQPAPKAVLDDPGGGSGSGSGTGTGSGGGGSKAGPACGGNGAGGAGAGAGPSPGGSVASGAAAGAAAGPVGAGGVGALAAAKGAASAGADGGRAVGVAAETQAASATGASAAGDSGPSAAPKPSPDNTSSSSAPQAQPMPKAVPQTVSEPSTKKAGKG